MVEAVRRKSTFREYAESIIVAVCLAMLIRMCVIQAFRIPSGSMLPTLQIGDHLFVQKFIYGIKIPFTDHQILPVREPARGDIIVFKYPENQKQDYIKRIIALPGEKVEIHKREVYVNDQPIEDPWGRCGEELAKLKDPDANCGYVPVRDEMAPRVVPEGEYFVMGDNRDNSRDSRFWGFVRKDFIKGKAWIVYWSWDSSHHWPRWSRMLMAIR